LVFHPINKKSKGVIDFSPTAHMDSEGGGTDELYAIEGILILMGYTVIIPDLIGSGISKDMQVPFLMAENTGRVAYDMRRAAAQYLWDEFKHQLPAETIIMGYSLGGSAALATQKYYETRHPNTVKVKEVYASSGAYDLVVAFEAFAKAGYSDYPAIPHTILAFKHYYFDCHDRELDLEQIFSGELLAKYTDWYSGKFKSMEIMEMLGTDIHAYMHEDFFKPYEEQNEALKSLFPYLIENSLTNGWRPKAPIYMTHSNTDTYVPVECAEAVVKSFRRAGATVSYITYPGTHLTVGYLWFLRSILHFL
jgi:dienelactone hydrolase